MGDVYWECIVRKKLPIKSDDEGPDFIANNNIYIECVASTRGDPSKTDSVKEMFVTKTPEEIHEQDVPVDKMILRITSAINNKALIQYKKWKSKDWFKQNAPFIIAINTSDLQYPDDSNMPTPIYLDLY